MGISNPADVEAYRLMSPAIEPLPIMACDWIDPRHYAPRPRAERSIDILMVANWLPFKRHWLLFSALRTMRKDLRVVLVGREAPGRTADTIRDEARSFGVTQDLELRTGIGIDEVTTLQCDSRISCLFSRREGSCVAVVESFFANAPVAMMRDAHVGSKAYINERTGVLLTTRDLGRQLSSFLERSDEFTPRQWALEHVTYEHSCRRLNETLRQRAVRTGRPWTKDIVPICWRPYPEYVDPVAASPLAEAVDGLRDRYGIELEPGASPRRAAAARLTTPEGARYTS
jgi:glycosyltransferase involved in cell wall biosynthesis